MDKVIKKEWFLRVTMGITFLYYGINKAMGGPQKFADSFNLPYFIGVLVILGEIGAGLGYLLDPFVPDLFSLGMNMNITTMASIVSIIILLYAIFIVHLDKGFNSMNGGFSYQFALLMIALYFLN